jgi:uncharacterized protein (DUF302 family)
MVMSNLLMALFGAAIGIIVTAVLARSMMRSKMVTPEKSAHSFEETCERIEQTVGEADGWSFPMDSFDMAAKLAEKNALPGNLRRVKLYYVCSPPVAKRVLGDSPHLSAIMPCTWSVYETTDGQVWLSSMNIPMMSKMMGGVVGESMGVVAEAEKRFLKQILV